MKVILLQDVKALGKKGDLVKASDGYARKFLLPKNLAREANAQAMNEYRNAENSKNFKIATEKKQAEGYKAQLEGKSRSGRQTFRQHYRKAGCRGNQKTV